MSLIFDFAQLFEHGFGDFVVGVRDDFARLAVDHVLRQHAAEQIVFRHRDELGLRGCRGRECASR